MKSVISKSVIKSVITATVLCFAVGTGTAFAQSAATPAAPAMPTAPAAVVAQPAAAKPVAAQPAAAKTAKPKLSPDEKKKVSQACSAQANEKQLHGKERQTFRAGCIRHGGTAT